MFSSQILSISSPAPWSAPHTSSVQQPPNPGALPSISDPHHSYTVTPAVTQQLKTSLKRSSNLLTKQIKKIIAYIQDNLPLLMANVQQTQTSVHLRSLDTHLAIPLEISKEGQIYLPLKSYGREIGRGTFSHAQLAICLTPSSCFIVVHSCTVLKSNLRMFFAATELCILNKIKNFQDTHPQAVGLLNFYGSIDYQSKTSSSKDNQLEVGSYSTSLKTDENRVSYPKRALMTEFYQAGNLQENLENLNFVNKLKIMHEVLNGLYHLHVDLKIFHSDLKLTNIFLRLENNVQAVIGDFGFACDLTVPEDRFFKAADAACMAPEIKGKIKTGQPIDESILACDIYSMGLLLNELLQPTTGKLKILIDQMLQADPLKRPGIKEILLEYNKTIKELCHLVLNNKINQR